MLVTKWTHFRITYRPKHVNGLYLVIFAAIPIALNLQVSVVVLTSACNVDFADAHTCEVVGVKEFDTAARVYRPMSIFHVYLQCWVVTCYM